MIRRIKKFIKRRNMKNVPEFLMYIDDIEYYNDVIRLLNKSYESNDIIKISEFFYNFYDEQKEKNPNYTIKEFIFLIKILIKNIWRLDSLLIVIIIGKFIVEKRFKEVFEIFDNINFKEDLSKSNLRILVSHICYSQNQDLINEFFEKYNRELGERFYFVNFGWLDCLKKLIECDCIDSKYFKISLYELFDLLKTYNSHDVEIIAKKTFKDFKFYYDDEKSIDFILYFLFKEYRSISLMDGEILKNILNILFEYREKPKIIKDVTIHCSDIIKILSEFDIQIDTETMKNFILNNPIEFIEYIDNSEFLIEVMSRFFSFKNDEIKKTLIKKCGHLFFNNYDTFKEYIKKEKSENILLSLILQYGEKIKDEEFLNIFYFVDNSNKEKIIKTFQQRFRNLFLNIVKNNIRQNNLKELIKLLLFCKPEMGIAVELAEIVDIHRVELLETVIKLYFPYIINDINSEYSERLKKLLTRVMVYNECKNSNYTALIK